MSDNFKWDGDLYQGTPDRESKYEYYPVGEERTASGVQGESPRIEDPAGPYHAPGPDPALYEEPSRRRRRKEKGPGSGVGKKFGMTITLALVFGLVAGLVFQGVNLLGRKFFPPEVPQIQQPTLPQTDAVSQEGASKSLTSVAAVAKSAMPSVVAITSVSVQEIPNFFGFGTQEYQGMSTGSGVIVGENDTELLIATNNHVVEDAKELTICFIGDDVMSAAKETQEKLQNNEGLDADGAVTAVVKGTDPSNDLAVVAVKKEDIPQETMAQIKIAKMGSSDALVVGEQVVAIGNALGYGQSVTSGWVSALDREVVFDGTNSTLMIQTDAAINPGNSGGALLNMQGELVGINSAKEAANVVEGMCYSIPISNASPILDDLMSRKTRERAEDGKGGYLGVMTADVTEEMMMMYNIPAGAFVREVIEGTCAEKYGIIQGDIIVKLDGQTVTSQADLLDKLTYYKKGEEVEVVVSRADNGKYKENVLTVVLDERPADAGQR